MKKLKTRVFMNGKRMRIWLKKPKREPLPLRCWGHAYTAGLHGVGTWHGAGPVMAQKIMLQRVINYDHEKELVRQTLNLREKEEK